jgi:DNA replication initiation complex subunit (GINS family)
MISFQDIYDLLRKEKYNEQLQSIAKNFLKEVAEYLRDKEKITSKESDVFSETIIKTKKQLENAVNIIKELMMIRERKILNLAVISSRTGVSKKDTEHMLSFEKDLFSELIKNLEYTHKKFDQALSGKEKKDLKKNILIRFTRDVPKFSDLEGNEIGPFKKGDVSNLPREIASILINDKSAIKVLPD